MSQTVTILDPPPAPKAVTSFMDGPKQLHCRRFYQTVSHELRGAAPGGARRWANIFITFPRERYVCIYYIYIVYLIVPKECNDKYMYTNTTCCSSRSLTARQKRLLWSFYMSQYIKYLPNFWVKVMENELCDEWALRLRAHSSPRSLSITYTRKYVIYYFFTFRDQTLYRKRRIKINDSKKLKSIF